MNYTIILTNSQASEIINKYHEYSVSHTNNYTLFRAKYKQASITIFKTLSLLIQGAGAAKVYKEICELLKIVNDIQLAFDMPDSNNNSDINLSIIGTDEVGTGDFFGPIVVVASFVPKDKISTLLRLKVKDSKELTDDVMINLAPILMKEIKYSALVLDNKKFNYLTRHQKFNMNKIKALLHNNAIYNLQQKLEDTKYDKIVIDAFSSADKYFEYLENEKNIIYNVELEEKAESKYIAVAASSIIARYFFLKELDRLSKEIGFELPKGAGNKVDLAISKILKEKTERYFDTCGKTNFKNLEKVKTQLKL